MRESVGAKLLQQPWEPLRYSILRILWLQMYASAATRCGSRRSESPLQINCREVCWNQTICYSNILWEI